MRKRRGISILVPLAAVLLTAPMASASNKAGWDCVANDTEADRTVLASGGSFIPMPPSVPPEGPKVITGWTVKAGPGLGPLPQRLELFEIKNEESEFEKIGESATETIVAGTNSFPTRIPTDEGDSVGLHGPAGTLVCREPGAISLLFAGSAASGEIKPFEGASGIGTPLVVDVEDDRDGDGYGDETQDKCPLNAATQGNCPKLKVGVVRVTFRPVSVIVVKVRPTSKVRIKVSCQIELPSQGARSSGAAVRLSSGPVQTVEPETTAISRFRLPAEVKRSLENLDAQRALKAKLTIQATDSAKRVRRSELTLRLKGQKHG
jgi:hypothetical protein